MSLPNPLTPEKKMTSFKSLIQSKIDDTYYTPDMPAICKFEEHYLFTYGTLKKGFCRNYYMEQNTRLIGSGYTLDKDMMMYRQNQKYGFPIVFKTDLQSINAHISGEVWLISTKKLIELDFIESNGSMYYREQLPIVIWTTDTKQQVVVHAWTYIGMPGYWRDKIVQREIIHCHKHRRKKDPLFEYYHFQRNWDFSSKKEEKAA